MQGGKLRYLRATQAVPTSGSHWLDHDVAATAGPNASLVVTGGVPAIAYGRASFAKPQPGLAWAESATPAGAGDWCLDPYITDTVSAKNLFMSASTFNGLPFVGFLGSGPFDSTQMQLVWGN